VQSDGTTAAAGDRHRSKRGHDGDDD
jgi:hypothetical protein